MSQGVEPKGSSTKDTTPHSQTEPKMVYRARRDLDVPVGHQIEVTVDGEPMDYRYDLLSASPSGFEWGYGGSGPAQLAIATLAHAYNNEFACEHYQRFKCEVVSELPKQGWTLTKDDLDAWREGVAGDA